MKWIVSCGNARGMSMGRPFGSLIRQEWSNQMESGRGRAQRHAHGLSDVFFCDGKG